MNESKEQLSPRFRILTVDDSPAIQEDYAKILSPIRPSRTKLESLASSIFGEDSVNQREPRLSFEHNAANSGENALRAVELSLEEGRPIALAFVDIRMPPGMDGVEAVRRIWEIDPRVNVVLCTAYSDYSWAEITEVLGDTDRLLILKKPFEKLEVLQMAHALCAKWKYEEGLRLKNEELEHLYSEQKEHAEDLAQTIEERNTFFARISHDIRTPLNGILGVMDLLRLTSPSPEQMEYLSVIEGSGKTLLRLVNDVLDYARIDSGHLELVLRPTDLEKVVEGTIKLLSVEANSRGLTLTQEIDPLSPKSLLADANRIEQILYNLIGNSLKYTTEGGIVVRVSAKPEAALMWKITLQVIDSGTGIPEESMEKIFQSFKMIDPTESRDNGGAGLGLAICQGLVELMDGEVSARNNDDRGTTFEVSFSLPEVFNADEKNAKSSRSSLNENISLGQTKKPILIVDDSEQNRFVVRRQLSSIGLASIEAENGILALDTVGEKEVSLILLDCQMPHIDGFEVLKRLKASKNERIANLPIIAITANAMAHDREKCMNAGFDGYISKPCTVERLQEVLVEFLG